MTDLKPCTQYRCPSGGTTFGHRSIWTGAYEGRHPANDHLCTCGDALAEVVEDGHTYRLEWEMDNGYGWHPTTKDSTDRTAIVAQWRTLSEWERTGAEPVRNVRLSRSSIAWEAFDPDADGASS